MKRTGSMEDRGSSPWGSALRAIPRTAPIGPAVEALEKGEAP
jgi:hypothetical protein